MDTEPAEMSVRELRADLADVINAASTRGQVTFVTSRGRRVAGVVSVAAAEQAAGAGPGGRRRRHRGDVRREPRDDAGPGRRPSLTPAECFEHYASDLLREFGGSVDRALAAARAVVAGSAGKSGYPTLWLQAALAVELCQRAAEITGRAARVLPPRQPGRRRHPAVTPPEWLAQPGQEGRAS